MLHECVSCEGNDVEMEVNYMYLISRDTLLSIHVDAAWGSSLLMISSPGLSRQASLIPAGVGIEAEVLSKFLPHLSRFSCSTRAH